jgi:DNA-binding transcriptional ArsR family regulator
MLMASFHKVFLMTETATETDILFKAIAHPARRQILTLLAASDQSVKELTSAFAISQPAVSQHLRELRDAKLVASSKVGSEQKYHLTGAPLKTVADWCAQYRRFFDPAGHAWAFTSLNDARPSESKESSSNGR